MAVNPDRCMLIEYTPSGSALMLEFELNPKTLSRSRSVPVRAGRAPGTRSGYDFRQPTETPRVAQGVTVQPETFSVTVLLDATDRMNAADPVAMKHGIEPELDTLRAMLEPKTQAPDGARKLASLGEGGERALDRQQSASVLLLVWGSHILPVFLTRVQVEEQAHLPSLVPYRAEVTLALEIIEGDNPFYQVETARQQTSAALSAGRTAGGAVSTSFGGPA